MDSLQKKFCMSVIAICLLIPAAFTQVNNRQAPAGDVVRAWLTSSRAQLKFTDYNELKTTGDYIDPSSGIRHIYIQQQFNGLDVVNGTSSVHVKTDGSIGHGNNNLLAVTNVNRSVDAVVGAEPAVKKALAEIGIRGPVALQIKAPATGVEQKIVYRSPGTLASDIPARKAYIISKKTKVLKLSWEVQLYQKDRKSYWIIYIDAITGELLSKQDMVISCNFGPSAETDGNVRHIGHAHFITPGQSCSDEYKTGLPQNNPIKLHEPANYDKGEKTNVGITNEYRVYDMPAESPIDIGASHSLVATGGNGLASPDGWHKVSNAILYPYARGNNAFSFYDPSPGPLGGIPSPTSSVLNNGGLGGTASPTEPFKFDYPVNLGMEPEVYRNAAIVNLFYWNNLMHDVFYQFGFIEAAQNFQDSHTFSTGTKPGNPAAPNMGQQDYVLAQAQDGGGTNNANMLTLADGTNGQMQMYLWTGSEPDSIVRIRSNSNGQLVGKKYLAIQGSFGNAAVNGNNNNLFTNPQLDKPFVIIKKNAAGVGTESQGCGLGQQGAGLPPSNNVTGKIVIVDRGGCSFVEKVYSAQLGGASAVIVVNNAPGPPIAMGGTDATGNVITIPAVMISLDDGKEIKARLVAGDSIHGDLQKTFPSLKRDGDFDNAVIGHEYGHGISTRLTAGGPNPTSRLGGDEQGGEGWSDFFGLYMTLRSGDLLPATTEHPNGVLPVKGIGNYVTYQPLNGRGIRPTPYSIDMTVNPSTYRTVGTGGEITVPHGVGYVWCTMLYDMEQNFIDSFGFNDNIYLNGQPAGGGGAPAGGGNNITLRLVMEGLKLQPASPTFVQQRDAILKADTLLYNAAYSCLIWRAFAKRGLGFSAKSNTNAVGDEDEQFNVAPACGVQSVLDITHTAPAIVPNTTFIDYNIRVINRTPTADPAPNTIITDTIPQFTSYISSDGGTLNGNVVTWPAVNFAAGDTINHTVKVIVNHPNPATLSLTENNEGANADNKFQHEPQGNGTWTLISNSAFSGTKVWFVEDYDIPGSNTSLAQKTAMVIPANSFLIFNHQYATEADFDGGVLEYSVDNVNWVHLNSFIKAGYNGVISNLDNPTIGTGPLAAFTGASPGYIQSIASLAAIAGQTARFRFRFTSDAAGGSVTGGGWWIDDIFIAAPASFIEAKASVIASNTPTRKTVASSSLIVQFGPLPVTGVELKASVRNKQVQLTWQTFAEIDNRGFEVLRKASNENNYIPVGFVNGAGNSNTLVNYSFTDLSAAKGIRYEYKLRQVDINNAFRFSNIASAIIIDKVFAFTLSPNPAKDKVVLLINNDSRENAVLRLTDMAGKTLMLLNLGNSSYQSKELNVSNLSQGIYILEITNSIEKQAEKLIIQ